MLWNNSGIDNDSWYVIAEGREIVENGIYWEDQLSMHEGLEVTVQNYGFAVIFYLMYSVAGPIGIYLCMLGLNLLICVILYKICMLLSQKNVNLSLCLMIFTDLLLGVGFVVTRAQMVSYVILLLVFYLLELYIRKGKTKYLWWIPVLSLLQVNLHASLWPMILLVTGVYIIDSFRCKRMHLQGYRTVPLLFTLLAAFLTGFINPYGVKMMTFILTSYGVPEAHNTIVELRAFTPLATGYDIVIYLMITVVILMYIFGKNRKIRVRYLLMLFGFLALGLNTVKGMAHLILVLFWPLAEVHKDFDFRKLATRKVRWMVLAWAGTLAVCIVIPTMILGLPEIAKSTENNPDVEVVKILDAEVGDGDKKALKIYAYFDSGGYYEYMGYKPYLDPRMEVFVKANNGKEEIFKEWYDLERGKVKENDFVEKYEFDYIVAREECALYDLEDDRYEMIYEGHGNAEVREKLTNGEELSDEEKELRDTIRLYKKIEM